MNTRRQPGTIDFTELAARQLGLVYGLDTHTRITKRALELLAAARKESTHVDPNANGVARNQARYEREWRGRRVAPESNGLEHVGTIVPRALSELLRPRKTRA